jgi:hypothetical protein
MIYIEHVLAIWGAICLVAAIVNWIVQKASEIPKDATRYGINVTGLMPDHVHFTADEYRQWIPPIVEAIEASCDKREAAIFK